LGSCKSERRKCRYETDEEGIAIPDFDVCIEPMESPMTTETDQPVTGNPEMKWYVLKVQTNREKSIREAIRRRIRRDGLSDRFGQIVIATEKVVETKSGERREVERKLYPGYLFIQMILDDETWYLVRDISGVGDFTGAGGVPVPMEDEEINRLIRQKEAANEPAKIKIPVSRGDVVKIKEGTFENFEGTVDAIDEASGKISVLIEIFGRSTPVELEYWQVERP
jgi:transcriptional antiterminator NusG